MHWPASIRPANWRRMLRCPTSIAASCIIKKGDTQNALEQLTKALEKQPENITALLVRAGLYYELKEPDKALADIDEAIRIQPAFVQPHLMRAEILAASERIDEAIAGLEKLLQAAPGNIRILSQLGTFYMIDSQPRKAIDVFSRVLEQESDNGRALRFRADAYLNTGQHAEAIADFDRALQEIEPDEGLLNNFAWVLATSPEDKLRDGKRAVELATKAAEISDFQTPHVLEHARRRLRRSRRLRLRQKVVGKVHRALPKRTRRSRNRRRARTHQN